MVAAAGLPSGAAVKRDADAVVASGPEDEGAAARKKKKLGPGSRGVANLTPDQLAKKRANGESFTFSPCFCPCLS